MWDIASVTPWLPILALVPPAVFGIIAAWMTWFRQSFDFEKLTMDVADRVLKGERVSQFTLTTAFRRLLRKPTLEEVRSLMHYVLPHLAAKLRNAAGSLVKTGNGGYLLAKPDEHRFWLKFWARAAFGGLFVVWLLVLFASLLELDNPVRPRLGWVAISALGVSVLGFYNGFKYWAAWRLTSLHESGKREGLVERFLDFQRLQRAAPEIQPKVSQAKPRTLRHRVLTNRHTGTQKR